MYSVWLEEKDGKGMDWTFVDSNFLIFIWRKIDMLWRSFFVLKDFKVIVSNRNKNFGYTEIRQVLRNPLPSGGGGGNEAETSMVEYAGMEGLDIW
jgi:hypothetical protein